MGKVRIVIGLVTSVALFYLSFRGVSPDEVAGALRGMRHVYLVPAAAVLTLTILMRAYRWKLLFHDQDHLRLGHLFGVMNVGFMVNNIVPLRVGDVARAYFIGGVEGVSRVRALSTVFVERVLDTLTLAIFLVALVPFVSLPERSRTPLFLVAGGLAAGVAALVLAAVQRERVARLSRWGARRAPARLAPSLEGAVHSGLDGLAAMGSGGGLARVSALSLGSWLLTAVPVYLLFLAFDIHLSFTAAVFILGATGLSMVVPTAGGVGVFHAVAIAALTTVFGVERAQAASYALVTHLLLYLTPVALGLAYLWRADYSWDMLLGSTKRVAGAEANGGDGVTGAQDRRPVGVVGATRPRRSRGRPGG